MQGTASISFRHLPHSPSVEAAIRAKISKLEKVFPRITSLKVMVERSILKKRNGNLYHIRIEMNLPGQSLTVSRDPAMNQNHEDIYVAIRDAFQAAKRQLTDYIEKHFQNESSASATPQLHGKISRKFPLDDFGFLITAEGREVYFHRNSVLDQLFDQLEFGEEVRFVESQGEKGPQASTVERIGKDGRHSVIPV